jgi:general secretion pathway protein H
VFDLDAKQYWVEESADIVRVQTQEDEEKEREEKERDKELAETLKSPDFKALEDEAGEKKTLPDDVHFKSIWTDRMTERVTKGQAALYFFPDGYTEEAQIVLSDNPDGTRLYDLVVEPMTGTVTIEDSELPIETK